VSVVVPARDEAGRVGGCVAALLAQDAKVVEVVVVDDGSQDATAAEAAAAGAPPAGTVRPGSGAATRSWWEKLLLPDLGLAVAERLDLDAVADPASPAAFLSGQCLLVRRDAYEAVGGFGAVAGSLVEALALARRLKAASGRLELRLAPDLAAVRMYGCFGDLWAGLAKNLAEVWGAGPADLTRQAARALAGLAPWLALAARPGPPARRVALAGGLLQLTVRAGGRLVAGADPRLALDYPAARNDPGTVVAEAGRRTPRGTGRRGG
jgi:hypothetical protein